MIIRERNEFGDVVAVGSGYVFVRSKQPPVREFTVNGSRRLHFLLSVGFKKMYDPKADESAKNKEKAYVYKYDTILCQLELKATNVNMYLACKQLKSYDRVDFKGSFFEESFTDKDGNEVPYSVLRLDSVTFPDKMAALLNGEKLVTKKQVIAQSVLKKNPQEENKKYPFN